MPVRARASLRRDDIDNCTRMSQPERARVRACVFHCRAATDVLHTSVAPKILVVCGSSRLDSHLEQVISLAGRSAHAAGSEVRELWLQSVQLPVMIWGDEVQARRDDVIAIREQARWADGFVLGTPEYHGNMSGALKNWFDFLYGELAGKLAGVVATTGGGTGDMSITAVKTCFSWCHGFVLPFHAAAGPASFESDVLTDVRVIERIERVGYDVARYAPLLRNAFEQARVVEGPASGFAGLHVDDG
jgi:NAD(P)H-dependent FMN reductase